MIIGTRKSDLALIQAESILKLIQSKKPEMQAKLFKRPSMGDLNLDMDLKTSDSKGVFTADFVSHLKQGDCDLVVHSWKDLPIQNNPGFKILAGPYREDQRDVLFLKKKSYQKKHLKVLTSSPRRECHARESLQSLLNFPAELSFDAIRGNIPTRFKKFLDSDADVYIVAKAAIDRLMGVKAAKYEKIQNEIKSIYDECLWMVLPLSLFPTAAAQGALALELEEKSPHLNFIKTLQNPQVLKAVNLERSFHKKFGGGCHLAIGFSAVSTQSGILLFGRGEHENKKFEHCHFYADKKWQKNFSSNEVFVSSSIATERHPIKTQHDFSKSKEYVISKKDAVSSVNQSLKANDLGSSRVYTAGLKTWKHLARKGFWVNGSLDSLGLEHKPDFNFLPSLSKMWLTHDDALDEKLGDFKKCAMYKVTYKISKKDLENKKVFYWNSGQAFVKALELAPESLKDADHFCGLGRTKNTLRKYLSESQIFYSYNEESFLNLLQANEADKRSV